ncbi:MAG: putative O-glycosylation ligase, exosortase A system-associated [Pseudomonadota bacterium]|nr:putative O-glycosylation ligase, exosortase A system-associated [Pseudomonadota bacterium]
MRDVIYHAAWLFILPLTLASAHLGVSVWIWVALLPPNDLLYGRLGIVLPFNKLVAASAFFALVTSQTKKDFYVDKLIMLVVAYAIIVTTSYVLCPYDSAFSDLQYDKFWKELVLFFLITGVMFSQHRLHQVALVVSLAFGFVMVKEGLIFLLTAGGHKIEAIGTVGDNSGVAMALLMTIPLLLYCAKYSADRWVRLGMYMTAGFGTVTVVATYSRGGFIGMLVLGLMLLKGSKYKIRALVAVGILAMGLFALMPDDYLGRISTISEAQSDDSFAIRLLAWKINYLLAVDHPFFGNGLYASLNWQNWFSHLGEATTWLFPSPLVLKTFVAHSIYFQVLGDTGFVGLLLFGGILLTALIKTIQTQRIVRRDPSLEWSGDLARATQMSLAVYCVSGAALSLVYFELLYVVLAMISRNHRTAAQLATTQTAVRGSLVPVRRAPAYARMA